MCVCVDLSVILIYVMESRVNLEEINRVCLPTLNISYLKHYCYLLKYWHKLSLSLLLCVQYKLNIYYIFISSHNSFWFLKQIRLENIFIDIFSLFFFFKCSKDTRGRMRRQSKASWEKQEMAKFRNGMCLGKNSVAWAQRRKKETFLIGGTWTCAG